MARNPVSYEDYRQRARRRLPRVLFDYIEGGSFIGTTLARNFADLDAVELRQRVLRDVSNVSTASELFGRQYAMPLALAPVGMAGMTARRGEVQASRAARARNVPFCLSTMAICGIEEVAAASGAPEWFQLYMIRDRGYMRALLQRAAGAGCQVLVFTVDLPVPGVRYKFSLGGKWTLDDQLRLTIDGLSHPAWMLDVFLGGRPHIFGNMAAAVERARGLGDFWGWIRENSEAGLDWKDIDWLRETWAGPIVLKGILDVEDARLAVSAGVDGIIVSNHGGRQLDGTCSSIAALPAVVEAVAGALPVLMDGGVRSGLDILKALALGASGCLVGRAWAYALASGGEAGVAALIDQLQRELATAMALTGARTVAEVDRNLILRV